MPSRAIKRATCARRPCCRPTASSGRAMPQARLVALPETEWWYSKSYADTESLCFVSACLTCEPEAAAVMSAMPCPSSCMACYAFLFFSFKAEPVAHDSRLCGAAAAHRPAPTFRPGGQGCVGWRWRACAQASKVRPASQRGAARACSAQRAAGWGLGLPRTGAWRRRPRARWSRCGAPSLPRAWVLQGGGRAFTSLQLGV